MVNQHSHQFWEAIPYISGNLKLLGFQLLYLIWFNIKLALVFIICSNRFLSKLLICYLKNKQACHPADTFVDCKYFWYILQSCPTLCDPMDCSLSGSSVHGIFQARVLEWKSELRVILLGLHSIFFQGLESIANILNWNI